MIILIVHHSSNLPFYRDLRKSLNGCKYKVMVVENEAHKSRHIANPEGGYELGALKVAMQRTGEDIFLLQDTCVIKNKKLFDIAASKKGGMAVCERFLSYLGKYDRSVLDKLELPHPGNKRQAIEYEHQFTHRYTCEDPHFSYLDPVLRDGERYEDKHGRLNMVLENEFIIKYKATWKL